MSQIATTIEQSKRLLDAGAGKATADMVYRPWTRSAAGFDLVTDFEFGKVFFQEDDIPAWSLSALWNLCKEKGYSLEFNTKEDTPEGMIENMVNILAEPIINIIDKLANNQI